MNIFLVIRLHMRKMPPCCIWIAAILLPLTSIAASTNCGQSEWTTFELVTGAILTAERGKMSSFQTFDLSECISACRSNPLCGSANFETGLCTTSQLDSALAPDTLRTDDFPVFPNYLEKLCLRVPASCDKEWSFQGVVNHFLPGFNTKTIQAKTKQDCLNACLNEEEFQCYSAEMRYDNLTCALSNVSQTTLQTKLQKVNEGQRIDYFENNCAKEARTYCEYNRIRGRVLKAADVVRSKVGSVEECKQLCMAANFSCNYYHYGQLSDDECSISHHTAITVSHISDPYVFSADFLSFELRACFAVELLCEAKRMTARMETNRIFDGLVYTKEQPKLCVNDVVNSSSFELSMPLDGSMCNTVSNGHGTYSNYIMIQYNRRIVTSKDVGLSVSCEYDLASQNVTGSLSTKGAPTITENVNYKVPSPIVQMSIRDLNGNPVVSATVGDKIFLQFDLAAAGSPDIYNIFVKDVVAIDGSGVGKTKIKMIDSNGCPSDDIVLGPVESINEGKTLRIPIEAFKFPSNDQVEFMALIKPCQKQCDPAQCIDDATQIAYNSYGRRRRRRRRQAIQKEGNDNMTQEGNLIGNETNNLSMDGYRQKPGWEFQSFPAENKTGRSHERDVLVKQRININDIFSNGPCLSGDCPPSLSSSSSSSSAASMPYKTYPLGIGVKETADLSGIVCIHKVAIAVASSVILLIQVVFVVALALICQRYRMQRKPHFKASLDISSSSSHSAGSTRTISNPIPFGIGVFRTEKCDGVYSFSSVSDAGTDEATVTPSTSHLPPDLDMIPRPPPPKQDDPL